MDILVLVAFFVGVALVVWAVTRLVIPRLARRALDHPNARSSHSAPTPRGAGLVIVPIVALGWFAAGFFASDTQVIWAAVGALILCVVSWNDDLRGLSPLVRLGAQAIVVAALLYRLPPETLHFQGYLPLWADRLAAGLLWLWFINLFNFMDGIDGISGVEAMAIGIGATVIAALMPAADDPGAGSVAGVIIAGAAFGFLFVNWHPAKVFLGDAGSVPFGLMLGWLLLDLAGRGAWLPAVILPLYYLTDATMTLSRRALRGEKIWLAHRQHYYQQAVARGLSHGRVAIMIAIADLGFIFLAALSLSQAWVALAAAAMLTFILLALMKAWMPA